MDRTDTKSPTLPFAIVHDCGIKELAQFPRLRRTAQPGASGLRGAAYEPDIFLDLSADLSSFLWPRTSPAPGNEIAFVTSGAERKCRLSRHGGLPGPAWIIHGSYNRKYCDPGCIAGAWTLWLISLPVFCCMVGLMRLAVLWLAAHELSQLRVLLWVELLLLVAVFALATALGPFPDADAWPALLTGMTAVAAMAVQNAAHRLHLTSAPPSTLMTGNITQLIIDAVDLSHGLAAGNTAVRARMLRMLIMIASFALGCGLAALLFAAVHSWCFATPLVLGLIAVFVSAGDEVPHSGPRN
jgi:uncharacterized membrane protein YoaK (UPF0700 family)